MATPLPRSAAVACVQRIAAAARLEALLELAVDRRVSRRELLAVREQVLPAQLDGVDTEALGGDVEERFHRPRELRHAEAPEGAAGRGVRVDSIAVQHEIRHAIRSRRRVHALLHDAGPDVGVGADVEVGETVRGHEPAVAPEAEPEPYARIAAPDDAERLLHGGGHAHGPARDPRQHRRDRLELRVGLAAEAAPERRHHDADPAERQVEHLRELDPHRVGVLRPCPHGQRPVLVPVGERGMGLHRAVLHLREDVLVLDHEIGGGEGRRGGAALVVELVADVRPGDGPERGQIGEVSGGRRRRVDQRRAGAERLLERGHGGQLLVLDLDRVHGVQRSRLVDGDHGGNGLALVAGDTGGKDRPVPERGTEVGIAPVKVRRRHHAVHAGERAGARDVDGHHARVRIGRAQELCVRHARQLEVGDVARLARDLAERVEPRHGLTDHSQRPLVPRHHRLPARTHASTAATILP